MKVLRKQLSGIKQQINKIYASETSMQKIDLAIVTWHQTYLSSYAGGYIRLREFLKRIPPKTNFLLLDNTPSIYSDILSSQYIIEYKSPEWVNKLQKKAFILWFFIETVFSTIILFNFCSKLAKNGTKVFYFPTAEFLQLYIVSILIKLRFPQVKVVLDILNYGILDKNYATYFSRMRKNGIGLIRSIVITSTIFLSSQFMKFTIKRADYIFTVSKDFVEKIKRDYKKNTIDYTPSGVNIPLKTDFKNQKKYLGVYIGRHTVEKGVFEVIEVWEKVVKKIPTAMLALAGYADSVVAESIKKEIVKRHLENNVAVFGDVTEEKKFKILSESELFIHLARFEPLFPVITILEGFSYGLPAVFYDMNVFRTAIKQFNLNKDSMFATRNGDTNAAAKVIEDYYYLSKAKKMELSLDAIKNAKLFSWDTIAKKEFAILRQLAYEK